MVGVWRGRQVEELLAQESNKALVDNLYSVYEQGMKEKRGKGFVNLLALEPGKDDPILVEAASLIPNQTKEYAQEVFGPGEFWVRRDMLLDAIGERQASVGDMFTGQTRWNPAVAKEFQQLALGMLGKDAYKILVTGERNIQEVVGVIKTNIVVKSVIVPAANIISNMAQLLNRGVPLRHIVRGTAKKTAEINTYIKRRKMEIDLEAELRAAEGDKDIVRARKLQTQIQSIQDSYRRMSIWPLIEAGEFSAISNGQVTAEDLALADGKWTVRRQGFWDN